MDIVSTLPAILAVALLAVAAPGPATLAIAATSMAHGRAKGVELALGVLTGSFFWSISAAAGLAALMMQVSWTLEVIRLAGCAYLFWLAFRSLRAAWVGGTAEGIAPARRAYLRGLMLHLTNPKAILFFGALYAVVLPGQDAAALALVVAAVGTQSAVVFLGYALLFSRPGTMRVWRRAARGINAVMGLALAGLGARLLTARLS